MFMLCTLSGGVVVAAILCLMLWSKVKRTTDGVVVQFAPIISSAYPYNCFLLHLPRSLPPLTLVWIGECSQDFHARLFVFLLNFHFGKEKDLTRDRDASDLRPMSRCRVPANEMPTL